VIDRPRAPQIAAAEPPRSDRDAATRDAATFGSVLRVAFVGLVLMAAALIVVGWTLTYLPVLDGTRAWDSRISEVLADSRTDEYESLAGFLSRLADAPSILALAGVITAILALARKWLAMAFVPLGLLIEFACFGAVNYAVQRPRPDVPKIGSVPSTFSYPSGHVAATVVCWIGVALLLAMFGHARLARGVAALGTLVVAFEAWARVYLGMHHVLDTALGVVMGGGALAIAARALWPTAFDTASPNVPLSVGDDDQMSRSTSRSATTTSPSSTSPSSSNRTTSVPA